MCRYNNPNSYGYMADKVYCYPQKFHSCNYKIHLHLKYGWYLSSSNIWANVWVSHLSNLSMLNYMLNKFIILIQSIHFYTNKNHFDLKIYWHQNKSNIILIKLLCYIYKKNKINYTGDNLHSLCHNNQEDRNKVHLNQDIFFFNLNNLNILVFNMNLKHKCSKLNYTLSFK